MAAVWVVPAVVLTVVALAVEITAAALAVEEAKAAIMVPAVRMVAEILLLIQMNPARYVLSHLEIMVPKIIKSVFVKHLKEMELVSRAALMVQVEMALAQIRMV